MITVGIILWAMTSAVITIHMHVLLLAPLPTAMTIGAYS